MKGCVYTDLNYAAARLSGTMVKLDGQPVYVNFVEEFDHVSVTDSFGNSSIVSLNQIDMSPFRIGYVNNEGFSNYLVRLPQRQWKQGFRHGQLKATLSRLPGITSKPMIDMLMGIYPTVNDCAENIVCGEAKSMAFSRYFSLDSLNTGAENLKLLYKGNPVGVINPKETSNLQPKWAPGKEYLKEMLQSNLLGEIK